VLMTRAPHQSSFVRGDTDGCLSLAQVQWRVDGKYL
jgi:hypothetical protein